MLARVILASLAWRRSRVALSMLVVAIGVGSAVALGSLSLQVGDQLAGTLRAAGPNFLVRPADAGFAAILGDEASAARSGGRLPERSPHDLKQSFWKNNLLEAAPERTVLARVSGVSAPVVGTWFDTELTIGDEVWRTGIARLRPLWSMEGAWPRDDADEAALGRSLAARLGVRPGGRVQIESDGRVRDFGVSGVVTSGGDEDRLAFVPLAKLDSLDGGQGFDRIWLSAMVRPTPRGGPPDPQRDPEGYERYMCSAYPENVVRELSSRVPGSEVLPLTEVIAGEARVVSRLQRVMIALAALGLLVSVLGLISTVTATVIEREVELSLLRALGASAGGLGTVLLGETLLIAGAGGAIGWLLGSLAAWLIRGSAFGTQPSFHFLMLPVAVVLAALVALAGTLGPLRLALRLDPARVLRG